MSGVNSGFDINLTGGIQFLGVEKAVQDLEQRLKSIKPIEIGVSGVGGAGRGRTGSPLQGGIAKGMGDAAIKARAAQKEISALNKELKRLDKDSRALDKLKQKAALAGSELETFGKQAAQTAKRFAAFLLVVNAFNSFTNALSTSINKAIEFEKEMLKISQVTGTSFKNLGDLEREITRLSSSLGVSSEKITDVALTLAQAGLTAKDTKVALEVLAKTDLSATFGDMKQTTEAAIAIMAQFGLEARDLEKQLSSINTVAAKFAVESSDIAVAIRQAGGSFSAAGGDLNELIALFTSVRATTRESAETISTGLRTIFTRLQRTRTVNFLSELGIQLHDAQGQFVGAYKAIGLLSDALQKIPTTDPRFLQIVEELGGYRQVNKVIPLLKQFETAQKALNVANRAGNSIDQDTIVAKQSLANQIARVKQEFDALIRSYLKDNVIRGLITTTLTLASAFIKLADSIRGIAPAITAAGLVGLFNIVKPIAKGFAKGAHTPFSTGASIIGRKRGGTVPGSGNGDIVPAMLEPGEFVVRKKAVQAFGIENLHKINRYATGGEVRKRFSTGGVTPENPSFQRLGRRLELGGVNSVLQGIIGDRKKSKAAKNVAREALANQELMSYIPKGSKFLGSGMQGLALETPDGRVVRLGFHGRRYENENISAAYDNTTGVTTYSSHKYHPRSKNANVVLQPLFARKFGDIQYELLPKATSMADFLSSKAAGKKTYGFYENDLMNRGTAQGLDPVDIKSSNIGAYGGKVLAVDPGTFIPEGSPLFVPARLKRRKYAGGGLVNRLSKYIPSFLRSDTTPLYSPDNFYSSYPEGPHFKKTLHALTLEFFLRQKAPKRYLPDTVSLPDFPQPTQPQFSTTPKLSSRLLRRIQDPNTLANLVRTGTNYQTGRDLNKSYIKSSAQFLDGLLIQTQAQRIAAQEERDRLSKNIATQPPLILPSGFELNPPPSPHQPIVVPNYPKKKPTPSKEFREYVRRQFRVVPKQPLSAQAKYRKNYDNAMRPEFGPPTVKTLNELFNPQGGPPPTSKSGKGRPKYIGNVPQPQVILPFTDTSALDYQRQFVHQPVIDKYGQIFGKNVKPVPQPVSPVVQGTAPIPAALRAAYGKDTLFERARNYLFGRKNKFLTPEVVEEELREIQKLTRIDLSKLLKGSTTIFSSLDIHQDKFGNRFSPEAIFVPENRAIGLNASEIKDKQTLRRILLHEIGHSIDLRVGGGKKFESKKQGGVLSKIVEDRRNLFLQNFDKSGHQFSGSASHKQYFSQDEEIIAELFKDIGLGLTGKNNITTVEQAKQFYGILQSRGLLLPPVRKASGGIVPMRFADGGRVPFKNIFKTASVSNTGYNPILKYYSYQGDRKMNAVLRGDFDASLSDEPLSVVRAKLGQLKKTFKDKKSLLKQIPSVLYRGLSNDGLKAIERQIGTSVINNDAVGKVFTDKGYSSTSRSDTTANVFARSGYRLNIIPKKTAKAIDMVRYSGITENEVLLDKGAKFKIVGFEPADLFNDKNIIRVQQLAAGGKVRDRVKKFAAGGNVPGSGRTDTVPALLTPGEFVVNRDSAKIFGYGNLHRINKLNSGGVAGSGGPAKFANRGVAGAALAVGGNIALFTAIEYATKQFGEMSGVMKSLTSGLAVGLAVAGTAIYKFSSTTKHGQDRLLALNNELAAFGNDLASLDALIANTKQVVTGGTIEQFDDTGTFTGYTKTKEAVLAEEALEAAEKTRAERVKMQEVVSKTTKEEEKAFALAQKRNKLLAAGALITGVAATVGTGLTSYSQSKAEQGEDTRLSGVGGGLSGAANLATIAGLAINFIPQLKALSLLKKVAVGVTAAGFGGAYGYASERASNNSLINQKIFSKQTEKLDKIFKEIDSGNTTIDIQRPNIDNLLNKFNKQILTVSEADRDAFKSQIATNVNAFEEIYQQSIKTAAELGLTNKDFEKFRQTNEDVILTLSRFGGKTIRELEEQYKKQIELAAVQNKIAEEDISNQKRLSDLANIASSLGDAKRAIIGFTSSLDTIDQIISGNPTLSKGNFDTSALQNIGGSSIQDVRQQAELFGGLLGGPGPQLGKDIVTAAELSSQIPSLIGQLVEGQRLNPEGDFLDLVTKSLNKGGKSNFASDLLRTAIGKEFGEGGSEVKFIEEYKRDPVGLAKRIQASLEPFTDIFADASNEIKTFFDDYTTSLGRSLQHLVTTIDSKISVIDGLQIQAEFTANTVGRTLSFQEGLGFDQQRFNAIGSLYTNSADIGADSQLLNTQIAGLSKQRDLESDRDKRKSLEDSIKDLTAESVKNSLALKHNADITGRLEVVNKELNRLQDERRNKGALGADYAFGSPEEKRNIVKGLLGVKRVLSNQEAGRDPLEGLSQEMRERAREIFQRFSGDRVFNGFTGEEKLNQIGKFPGVNQDFNTPTAQEKVVSDIGQAIIADGIEARKQFATVAAENSDKYIAALDKQFKAFFSKLDESILFKQQKIETDRKAEEKIINDSKLAKKNNVDKLTKLTGIDFSKEGNVNAALKELKDREESDKLAKEVERLKKSKQRALGLTGEQRFREVETGLNAKAAEAVHTPPSWFQTGVTGVGQAAGFVTGSDTWSEDFSTTTLKTKYDEEIQKLLENKKLLDAGLGGLLGKNGKKVLQVLLKNKKLLDAFKPQGKAFGGAIGTDTVPAATPDGRPFMLTPGEFIMNRGAVRKYGYETLRAMNATGMAVGGPVPNDDWWMSHYAGKTRLKKVPDEYLSTTGKTEEGLFNRAGVGLSPTLAQRAREQSKRHIENVRAAQIRRGIIPGSSAANVPYEATQGNLDRYGTNVDYFLGKYKNSPNPFTAGVTGKFGGYDPNRTKVPQSAISVQRARGEQEAIVYNKAYSKKYAELRKQGDSVSEAKKHANLSGINAIDEARAAKELNSINNVGTTKDQELLKKGRDSTNIDIARRDFQHNSQRAIEARARNEQRKQEIIAKRDVKLNKLNAQAAANGPGLAIQNQNTPVKPEVKKQIEAQPQVNPQLVKEWNDIANKLAGAKLTLEISGTVDVRIIEGNLGDKITEKFRDAITEYVDDKITTTLNKFASANNLGQAPTPVGVKAGKK